MISDIQTAIANKLQELYPTHKRYIDDVPQNFGKPSFLITMINQDYSKRMNTKNKGLVSYDVSYFSDKANTNIKSDCRTVQEVLLREFDLVGTFRAINKRAEIVDNVLHFMFDINYSEMKVETQIPMQTQETNTNI